MAIAVSRLVGASDGFTEVVTLFVFAQEEDWKGKFDRIEVWRSRGLSTGPFEPMTSASWAPARVPADGGDKPAVPVLGATVDVVGRALNLLLNERDPLAVTFVDPGPGTLTLQQAAGQIQAASAGRLQAWVDDNGKLVLETLEPGTGAALRVQGGDAAPLLGLPLTEPDSLAFGLAAHIALMKGIEKYAFNDIRGSSAYFYRTRFLNTPDYTVSSFSTPSEANQYLGVSAANIVVGQLSVVQLDGRPLKNLLVRVFNRYTTQQVEGQLVAGNALDALTDDNGKVEFLLVRGSKVTVAIDGTDIVRDIVVPADPAVQHFNLLDPQLTTNDVFTVRVPQLEYAQRRSL